MSYSFHPDRMYRMPTHFGPYPGPRQRPDGGRFDTTNSPFTTTVSVSYRTDATKLERLLPPGVELSEPIITIDARYITNVEWLAGRGYNVVAVRFPVIIQSKEEQVSGSFLSVVWENRTEPIITGREELGWPKIYGEIPELKWRDDEVGGTVGWDGFTFLRFGISHLIEEGEAPLPAPAPLLMLKYVPRTGDWGKADACYVTESPVPSSRHILRRSIGEGWLQFHPATWEQLPTLVHIVNPLADLEITEIVTASLVDSVGGKDYRDQRIIV